MEFTLCLSSLLSTGSYHTSHTGRHCSHIPRTGTHRRQSSARVPLCDFVHPQWSDNLHSLHPLQDLPWTADQVNSVPAAVLRSCPNREKSVRRAWFVQTVLLMIIWRFCYCKHVAWTFLLNNLSVCHSAHVFLHLQVKSSKKLHHKVNN